MAKYYILLDYLIPEYDGDKSVIRSGNRSMRQRKKYYKDENKILPENYTLIKFSQDLYVKVIRYNIDDGHLLIKAPSLDEAYEMANAIMSFLGIFYGSMPNDRSSEFYLQEIKRIPHPSWSESYFLSQLEHYDQDNPFFIQRLHSGQYIPRNALNDVTDFLRNIYSSKNVLYCMNNLLESLFLDYGYMTGSYYSSHYKYQRKHISRRLLKKRYFELRHRYESAFISAFKAIESFLWSIKLEKRRQSLCSPRIAMRTFPLIQSISDITKYSWGIRKE